MELLEKARDRWAEKYEAQQAEIRFIWQMAEEDIRNGVTGDSTHQIEATARAALGEQCKQPE
jgi:hypothetical protein